MPSISKEIVSSILDKDNFNANEKVYDALYGKSSDQLQTRKMQIAKHFFDPDYQIDQDKEENIEPTSDMPPEEGGVEPTETSEEQPS